MRRRSLLALAASLVLLVVFVTVTGPTTLFGEVADADLPVFALGLVAMVATQLCWSAGIGPLLSDAGSSVPLWRLLVAYTTAMLGRQLVPVGALGGPAITAYTVDREVTLSYNETLAVVTVAEFLGTVASLVLAAVGVLYLLLMARVVPRIRLFVVAVAAFAVLFGALTVGFWFRRGSVERVVLTSARLLRSTAGRISARLSGALAPDRASSGLDRFYETVDGLAANRRAVAVSYGWHQLGWVFSVVPLYTSALALGVDLPLTLAFFLVPASHLVAVLPLPGGLGGVELVLAGAIVVLVGIDPALAGAVVVLYRLCSYWFLVVLGVVGSIYSATSVRDLTTRAGR